MPPPQGLIGLSGIGWYINYFVNSIVALCENGWEYIGGSCHKLLTGYSSYNSAQQKCNALNAALPTIENPSKAYYLEQNSKNSKTWIGLTDVASENTWIWESGSTSTYRKWMMNKPDGGSSEDCAVVDGSGNANTTGWDDVRCNSCHQTQCEKGKIKSFLIWRFFI